MSTATEALTTEEPKADAQTAVARPKPEKLIVNDSGPSAHLFDTARFEQVYRIAKAIAQASLIPDHLCIDKQKNYLPQHVIEANCFLIVNQAIRWGMDPFALPPETYVVSGKLGYQGKLVAAVINARADLNRPLQCIYNDGKGDELAVVVFGSEKPIPNEAWALLKKYARDESGDAYTDLMSLGVMCIRVSVGQAKTTNDMWKKDPQQKLFYTGATKWARRHRPEIILGVLTDDDLDRMTITSTATLPPPDNMDALATRLEFREMPVDTSGNQEAATDGTLGTGGDAEVIDPAMLAKFDGCEQTREAIEARFAEKMNTVGHLQPLADARDFLLSKLPPKTEGKKQKSMV